MGFVRISVGDRITADGRHVIVTHIVAADQVIVRDLGTGAVQQISIRNIQSATEAVPEPPRQTDLSLISDHDWAVALMRYEAIKPLLEARGVEVATVTEIARNTGRHPATIYRWLNRYRQEGQQSALIPVKRGIETGHSRLKPEVEAIINTAIKERYLTRNRVKATHLRREVVLKCRSAGFPAPHVNTIRKRLSHLDPRTAVESRSGKRAAQEQFDPIKGRFPGAQRPLAVVQIDHTKLDLVVVDGVNREPLTRPWLTVAIDVFSRMVVGFYLSLEAPSAASTGICISTAMLPKDALLAGWGIATPWPVWGKMAALHCDNGKDFRGSMLRQACQEYGIELLFRPVRQPHYGGHIERLMGTFAREIHCLPGTTFSNPGERKGYDSDKNSALTLRELELWIARYIIEIYHQTPHSGLGGLVPIRVYEQCIAATGLPELCLNPEQLRLDFMPFEHRSVTVNGIVVDNIAYFHDVLRPWINRKGKNGQRRRFVVRRDPRDVSSVHFFDPELKQYFAIPYRDTSHPPISVWELREIRRRLKQSGRDSTDETLIFQAYEQMRGIEHTAVRKTKEMRRNIERRNSRPLRESSGVPSTGSMDVVWWEEDVQPFNDVVIPK